MEDRMVYNLMISLRCVLPIMALILLGFFLRRIRFLGDAGVEQMNKLSYRLLLPAVLFRSVLTADYANGLDVRLILIALGVSVFSFLAALLLASLKCRKDRLARASMAQAILRNNAVVFGMSLITSMYGEAATSTFSMLLAFVIPFNNILTVILMSLLTSKNVRPLPVLKSIVTNPFVIAVAAAFLVRLTGWKLPASAETVMNNIAGAAAAVALLGLGAGLRFDHVARQEWENITFGVIARLVLLQLLCVPVLLLLGVRGIPLVALYALIATPTAESSYIMAKEMGADAQLAGRLVVFQTAFSPLTILIGLTILSSGGWI